MTDITDSQADTATNPHPPGSVRNPLPNMNAGNDDPTSADGTDTDTVDWKAEAEKQRAFARKHEDRAKANAQAAKELEQLKQSSMNETEKAVAQARLDARTEAFREVGGRLAESAIRVAAAGRNVDVEALIEGIDAARFLDEEGEPNTQAITAWMDRVAPVVDDSDKPAPRRDLGLGARGQAAPALNSNELERALTRALGM